MKKLLLFIANCLPLIAIAQTPPQSTCSVVLVPEGDYLCILERAPLDLSVARACRGNMVCYTAVASSGTTLTWEVEGGSWDPLTTGTQCCVTWGDDAGGRVTVMATDVTGNECTATIQVVLEDKPVIGLRSVPNYIVNPSDPTSKTITVCSGDSVTLTDNSTSLLTPITGYFWESSFGTSVGSSFSFTAPSQGTYTIYHRVYNECGCYDEEEITLKVGESCDYDLSCVGTVCAKSIVTYNIDDASCTDYLWNVEGGTLVGGQHTPSPTVQWGEPEIGYGSLYLDGGLCDCECLSQRSVRVPVISDNVMLSGPDTICPNVVVRFSMPLWGSTEYTWTVTPSTGVTIDYDSVPGRVDIKFSHTGWYDIETEYKCDFLNCGPFSVTKHVLVQPQLVIVSPTDHTVCVGNAVSFSSSAAGVCRWSVWRDGQPVTQPATCTTFSHTFTTPGIYTVRAGNDGYCNYAEFLVEAVPGPDPIPISDITGPLRVCPNSTMAYSVTPAGNRYCTHWEWVKDGVTKTWTGDNVYIDFGNTVGAVNVYRMDILTGCQSVATVYPVTAFQPSPWPYSGILRKCEGETFSLQVDNEEDMVVYEWSATPANAISFQNDNWGHQVSALPNYLTSSPYDAWVILNRKACPDNSGNYHIQIKDTVQLRIGELASFSILPTTACEVATLTIDNPTLLSMSDASRCYWEISGPGNNTWTEHGIPVDVEFPTTGNYSITLHYYTQQGCYAMVSGNCYAHVLPLCHIDISGGQLCVQGLDASYDYSWNPVPGSGPCIQYLPSIMHYTCTVTHQETHCSNILDYDGPVYGHSPICNTYVAGMITDVSHCCFNKYTVTVNTGNNGVTTPYSMRIIQFGRTLASFLGLTSSTTDILVPKVGPFIVCIEWNDGICKYSVSDEYTVQTVLNFDVSSDCQNIIVHDYSEYASGFLPNRTIMVYSDASTPPGIPTTTQSMPSSSRHLSIPFTPDGISHRVRIALGSSPCCYIDTYVQHNIPPSITPPQISGHLCANTPVLFSASVNGTSPLTYRWDFGDGSHNYGNDIYHVYGSSFSNDITLTVKDGSGCVSTWTKNHAQVTIHTKPNLFVRQLSDAICYGDNATLESYPGDGSSTYAWEHDATLTTQYAIVKDGGNYKAFENTQYGCQLEAIGNASYPNEIPAVIICDGTYCDGDKVTAFGNVGSNFTYQWTVTPAPTSPPLSYSSPNLSFTTNYPPSTNGVYTLGLTVSTAGSICTNSVSKAISIHPLPPAPTISFGTNPCITEGPVDLISTGGNILLWSNGNHGTSAQYYTSGLASAYYVNPTTGCKSMLATILIPRPPAFDALLTGCYRKCDTELSSNLPVYGLGVTEDSPWEWYLNDELIASGNTTPPSPVVDLPLSESGEYRLSVTDYGKGCDAISPELIIETMECDDPLEDADLNVTVQSISCLSTGCSLYYYVQIKICNISGEDIWIEKFYGQNIQQTLHPNDCINVFKNIPFSVPMPPYIYCEISFGPEMVDTISIGPVTWPKCNIKEDCNISINPVFALNATMNSGGQTVYMDYYLTMPTTVSAVIAVWSDDGQVITQNNTLPVATGTLMLDFGRLSQAAAGENEICLNVLCCIDNGQEFCIQKVCIKAINLHDIATGTINPDIPEFSKGSIGTSSFETNTMALAPNPTTGTVTVVDATTGNPLQDVAALTVLSILGQQVLHSSGKSRFDMTKFPSGAYIVRVVTEDGTIENIKLTKK